MVSVGKMETGIPVPERIMVWRTSSETAAAESIMTMADFPQCAMKAVHGLKVDTMTPETGIVLMMADMRRCAMYTEMRQTCFIMDIPTFRPPMEAMIPDMTEESGKQCGQ